MTLPCIERCADHRQINMQDFQHIFVFRVPGVNCQARGQTIGEIGWDLALYTLESQNTVFLF